MIYRFDDYALDTGSLELRRGDEVVPVEPQVFSLLVYIIENRDRVVSKDELVEAIWEGRAISDGALNSRMNAARRAVGDSGEAQAAIKTFPRRGFKFMAKLEADEQLAARAQTTTGAAGKPSIAVLPFANLSGDPGQDYFSDGITEDIITALSRIRQFFVVARNTTFTYKGQQVDVQKLAREMGVRYVLEGSVRKAGARVRITAQLIDGCTGKHIWAEKFDRELEDIFAIQDQITELVVAELEPRLEAAERERSKSKPAQNLDAWDHYQRGMSHIYHPGRRAEPDEFKLAAAAFRNAIAIDETFSRAYAGLAYCLRLGVTLGISKSPDNDLALALNAAQRAVELDPEDSLARCNLGFVLLYLGRHAEGVAEAESAVELNPTDSRALLILGHILCGMGRAAEAVQQLERARELSPYNPVSGPTDANLAMALIQLSRFDEAVETAQRSLRNPTTEIWGNCALIAALGHLGRLEEAQTAITEIRSRRPDFGISGMREISRFSDARLFDIYADGLRKAGLPEL